MQRYFLLIMCCLMGGCVPAYAQSSRCNDAAAHVVTQVDVPGRPFAAVPSADGCVIFVSLTAKSGRSQIIALARSTGAMSQVRALTVPGQLTGLALSQDGRTLAGANGRGVALISVQRLLNGAEEAILGMLDEGDGAGSVYVAFSPDDRLLAVSDERKNKLSIYDLAAMRAGEGVRMLGQVRTGAAPVGLAFSPDGRRLYSTSEVVPGERVCQAESRGTMHPQGALTVIDVERVRADLESAVIAKVAAGCNPVRVVLSPAGDRAYVTARGSNAVQVFDASKLVEDPDHSRIASVVVGSAPVGVAVDEAHVFVANSDRFGGGRRQSISVLDARNLDAVASIPAAGFPRELRITGDGKSLLVTNFESGSVELVDLQRLAELQTVPAR